VRECPRCRARIADHTSFLKQATEAEVPGLASIEQRMATALRAEMDRVAAPATAPEERAVPDRTRARVTGKGGLRDPWAMLRGWRIPAWAAAAAAVAIVAGGLFALRPRGFEGDVLRETPSADRSAAEEVRALLSRVEGERAHLSWDAVPGADAYVVLSLAPDLSERARFGPFTATTAALPLDSLSGGAPSGTPLVWQVLALRGGDTVARSPIQTLNTAR
jgi:hypothetical protein